MFFVKSIKKRGEDMTGQEAFQELGFPYEELVARFSGNEKLAERFLKKFVEDKTYGALCQAIEEDDYAKIEGFAHTLKGVAANLDLQSIFHYAEAVVKAVRQKQYSEIPPLFELLQQSYEQVIFVLKQLD